MVSKNLIAASSKPLILAILRQGENYGYRIIQSVKELSGGKLDWADGMLYPVLHRLQKEGLVSTKWKMSDGGRMRKYYRLTDKGHEALITEKEHWMTVHNILQKLWQPEPSLDSI
ncbi:PadR family transcriptional regulator [Bacteroidota bacterium]